MEETLERQQYELAFHLLPSFSEADIETKRREIEELISKSGGIVGRLGEVKKIRLAYPIKREKFSNFGYLEFFAPKNTVVKINKELALNENLLRHLVVKKEKERALKPKPVRPAKLRTEKADKEATPTEITETKETKEIDKKIEEILEKL